MCNENLKISERVRQTIRDYTLFDDIFMSVAFNDNIELTQHVLRVILGMDDLIVTSSKSQDELGSLFGRGVRLDVLARDSSGNAYDIEVQRTRDADLYKRVRYYQSMLDSEALKKGQDFREINRSYIIFIMDYDLIGKGLPIYHVESCIKETGDLCEDGREILYVNGTYRDLSTSVGSLMHDFACSDYRQIKNDVIRDTVRECKEPESRGNRRMSELFERVFKDYLDKYQEDLLNERNKLIETERDLQEKTRTLQEKNQALQEKNQALQEKTQALQEADQALQERDQALKESKKREKRLEEILKKHDIDYASELQIK